MKPPRDNSKLIDTEVVPAENRQISNVGNLAALGPIDQVIQDIRADHALFEKHSKMAAFLALRIGLRLVWVKNNSGHGSLDPFIKQHFAGVARSSLANYMRIADAFVTDCGLRDKKTHKLTDSAGVRPILGQQMELFTDPKAKLDIHCQQLVKWVDGRGLTQIYRDLAHEDASPPPAPQPGKKAKKKTPEQIKREEFEMSLTGLKHDFADKKWQHLFEKERLELERWLTKAAQTVRDFNAQSAKAGRARK